MTSIECRILTEKSEVAALADQWRALSKRASTSMFTDYDWFDIWWRTVGDNGKRTLHIIAAHADGKLVGVLPLVVIRRKGFRVLEAIGAEAFYYCDILCETSEQGRALWEAAHASSHYDFAQLRDVVSDSLNDRLLTAFAALHDRDTSFYLRLEWDSVEAWKAATPIATRKSLLRRVRRLEEQGPITYEICTKPPVPKQVVAGMVEHKTLWCRAHNKEGMFDQPNILDYYQHIADRAANDGTLALAWLTCGDEIMAYHLMYCLNKKIYSCVMATDEKWLYYSPGNLALLRAIPWAIENGYKEFDHMQGDFAYKRDFSNASRECREYCFHKGLRGAFGLQLFMKHRALKRWLAARKTQKPIVANAD